MAVVHVAALLDPEVTNARLHAFHAWGHKCNANDVLAIMRKHHPNHEFVDDLASQTVLSISADFSELLALFKKWASLEDSIVENVESIMKFA